MTQPCVACIDGQNYAGIALKLQETAVHAEECIYALETQLRRATNPATIYASTAVAAGIPANTIVSLGVTNTTLFSNSTLNSFYVQSQWTQPGIWQIGFYVTATASGAVTDNSYRHLYAAVKQPDVSFPPPSLPYPGISQVALVTYTEPNSGSGVDMTISATVVLDIEEESPLFFFAHGNVASTISLSTGLIWATRIGDTETLRVV